METSKTSDDNIEKPQTISSSRLAGSTSSTTEEITIGTVDFTTSSENCVVPFMVLPSSVEMPEVLPAMKTSWKLEIPRMALMIISDPSPQLAWKDIKAVNCFVTGLVKAMNTTKMWIFTNGYNAGIAREIGEGYRTEMLKRRSLTCSDHDIHKVHYPELSLIGVCSYESLTYGHALIRFPRPIRITNGRYIRTEGKYDLNPNHSHLMVVKSGTSQNVSVLKFLRKLATEMRAVEYRSILNLQDQSYRVSDVSVIAVVIQGGVDALDFVLNHLKSGLPVVVINGSGGLADLIAHIHNEIEWMPQGTNFAEYAEKVLKPQICTKAARMFPILRDSLLSQTYFYEKLFQCVRFGSMLESKFLYILDSGELKRGLEDLPTHLLQVLFKCSSSHKMKSMQVRNDIYMAMDWNCPDVALSEIFEKEDSTNVTIENEHFIKALLKPNREGFVELFLKQGFQVHNFLNTQQLLHLFQKSLMKDFFRNIIWEGVLGYSAAKEVTKDFIKIKLNSLVEDFSHISSFINTKELDKNFELGYSQSEQQKAEQKALAIVVLWSVLSYRMSLTKSLWKYSEQPICLSLFISMILKKLSTLSFIDSILKSEIKQHYFEYSTLAYEILDALYKDCPSKAYDIIREKNPIYAYQTMMEMAAFVENKTFLAHECCQQWLDNLFMGNIRFKEGEIASRTPTWFKITLSAFLVFPMYSWISFFVSLDQNTDFKVGHIKANLKEAKSFSKSKTWTWADVKWDKQREKVGEVTSDVQFVEIHPNILKRIYYMWSAPITKFWINQLIYCIFLVLLGLSVIWPGCGNTNIDICICGYMFFSLLSHTHNMFALKKRYATTPITWRSFEVAIIAAFFLVYLMGRILPTRQYAHQFSIRVIMCFSLLFFFYRAIFMFLPISSNLGPLLYRIRRMVLQDFVSFMRMALLFMICNGIILQCLLYPDFPVNQELFLRTINKIWIYLFKLHGISMVEEETSCVRYVERSTDSKLCRAGNYVDVTCPTSSLWWLIFFVQYQTFLKIILMAMLYALFSATHKKLREESDFIWKFQRYQLVTEFSVYGIPPPLNLLEYIWILFTRLKIFLPMKHNHRNTDNEPLESFLTGTHYERKYNPTIVAEYIQKQEKKLTDVRKEINEMCILKERLRNQKKMLAEMDSRVTDLQGELAYTRKYLDKVNQSPSSDSHKIKQQLSRTTPYPFTRVQRFPVPDTRVPWKTEWSIYDPIAYTLKKEDFRASIQHFVDDDIYIYEWLATPAKDSTRPVFKWNQISESAAGFYLNRKTWIKDEDGNHVDYEIDTEGLPRNPYGRTGLRGKAQLPRWGPNHVCHALITRPHQPPSWPEDKRLDFVIATTFSMIGKQIITLPGNFITTFKKNDVISKFFCNDSGEPTAPWSTSDDMIEYFRTRKESESEEVVTSIAYQGYADNHFNTDQAWIEIELWHVHFSEAGIGEKFFAPNTRWELLCLLSLNKTDEIFHSLVKTAAARFKSTLV